MVKLKPLPPYPIADASSDSPGRRPLPPIADASSDSPGRRPLPRFSAPNVGEIAEA